MYKLLESGDRNCFLFLYRKISTHKHVQCIQIKVHVFVYFTNSQST